MINQIGGFEDIVEKGQSSARKIQNSAAKNVQSFAKTASNQVSSQSSSNQGQGTNEVGSSQQNQQMSDDDAKKFLQDLYGVKNSNQNNVSMPPQPQNPPNQQNVKTALGLGDSSQKKAPTPTETIKTAMGIPESVPQKTHPSQNQNAVATAMGIPQSDPNAGKTPQDLAKIEALRKQLHEEYYQGLVNPKKTPEEHVTQKLEREEKEEKMSELEVQKKKPPPLPATVKRGTGETVVGVSG